MLDPTEGGLRGTQVYVKVIASLLASLPEWSLKKKKEVS